MAGHSMRKLYLKYQIKIAVLHSDIIRLAAKNGWSVSVTASGDNSFFFDFQRRTAGDLPFCFTAELSGGLVGTLVDEIISFVDELDPERYAGEWLEASGPLTPARYFRAVDDMDEIRNQAWRLALDLSELAERQNKLLSPQWYLWN